MHLFKVWDGNREKKAFILVKENDIYTNLILQASQKLDVNGSSLVLESDGTPVEEDETLIMLKSETFILLGAHEVWRSKNDLNLSRASTITLEGNDCDARSDNMQDFLIDNGNIPITNCDARNDNTQEFLINNGSIPIINDVEANGAATVVQIIKVDCNFEYLWKNFQIPWHKIPENMLAACAEDKRDKYVTTEIVHVIINDMRQIKQSIPRVALKTVANKLCDKYPKMFQDVDEDTGFPVAGGSCTIFAKLLERATYLNRPHKRERNDVSPSVPPALKKRKASSMAGCSHWQPERTSNDEKSKSDRQMLNNIDERNPDFYQLLEASYAEQRTFLNNIVDAPSVSDVKREWPVLFNKNAIKWHFNKLTGSNLDILSENLNNKAAKIVQFGLKTKLINCIEAENLKYQSLEVFAKYFKEDFSTLYYNLKNSSDIEELLTISAPCIVKTEKDISVYLEKVRVTDCDNFIEALQTAFALYFNMNLEYPKEISTTLEMIQRYFLKIHPDAGSKSQKNSSSKKKVIALMNKLKDVN